MKCDVCGTESDFAASFVKEHKSFRLRQRTLCRVCWRQRQLTSGGWYHLAILVAGIVGLILLWRNPSSGAARFLTTILLLEIFLILSIVPHELGHALAGRLAGWRVFAVVIGIGKEAFKFRLGGIIFSFHWLPVAGITRLAPMDARWIRVKRFFVVLAGPAVNAAIVAVILFIWWDSWRESGLMGLPLAPRLCLWANLCVLAVNLWPRRIKGLNLATDGKQLLKTFSRNPGDMEDLQAARFAQEASVRRDEYNDPAGALDWCNRGLALFPNHAHLLTMSGLLCLDEQDYTRAREIFLRLLTPEAKSNQLRYITLNNIAYADALSGDPALLPEADACSKEAYGMLPWTPSIVGTRGTVLVAMGQVEAGIKLLKESFDKGDRPRGRAENACHLAMAHARIGNRGQAEKYFKLAGQLDPQCRLIERARKEFQKLE